MDVQDGEDYFDEEDSIENNLLNQNQIDESTEKYN